MTVCLLDVNVLVALVDPAHVQHEQAHAWFARIGHESFATCPITENGLLRIVGHPKYPNSPGSPAAAVAALAAMRELEGHTFWADDINISLAGRQHVDPSRLSSHTQVTDSYLLALACAHGGRLVSLDRKLVFSMHCLVLSTGACAVLKLRLAGRGAIKRLTEVAVVVVLALGVGFCMAIADPVLDYLVVASCSALEVCSQPGFANSLMRGVHVAANWTNTPVAVLMVTLFSIGAFAVQEVAQREHNTSALRGVA